MAGAHRKAEVSQLPARSEEMVEAVSKRKKHHRHPVDLVAAHLAQHHHQRHPHLQKAVHAAIQAKTAVAMQDLMLMLVLWQIPRH